MSRDESAAAVGAPRYFAPSAAFPVRILSGRYLGVYASGDGAVREGVTRSPHSRQNVAVGGSSVPQLAQVIAGEPRIRNKMSPARDSGTDTPDAS